MIPLAVVAELLELTLTYPRACETEGIEAIARRYTCSEQAVDLADRLSAWKRRDRALDAMEAA